MNQIKKWFTIKAICVAFLSIHASCNDSTQNKNNPVSFKNVELELPSTWNYKPQEIEANLAYQITCWEKGKMNTLVIQWFETEVDLKDCLDNLRGTLSEQNIYRNAKFSNYLNGDFKDSKALMLTYHGELLNSRFSGKITAFNKNGRTFMILGQVDNGLLKLKKIDKIISSISFDNDKSEVNKDIPIKWTLYELQDIGQIAIPPSLELRDDNSYISLVADVVKDSYVTNKKIKLVESQLIFQPAGTNQLEKDALTQYARILVKYKKGEYGDYYKSNERFDFTDTEINELENYLKNDVVSPMELLNIKLIDWFPMEFGKINNLSYLKTSFTRQMNQNPMVKVEKYNFFNSNESVEITLSYRLAEGNIWEKDFDKIINYFDFKTRR